MKYWVEVRGDRGWEGAISWTGEVIYGGNGGDRDSGNDPLAKMKVDRISVVINQT